MKNLIVLFLTLTSTIVGCSSMTALEKEHKRSELDNMTTSAIEGLIKQNPALKTKIEQALGYGVVNMKLTKVPIVGAGGGEGVFVNQKSQKRTYFTVSRFDIGGGWGVRSYKALILVNSQSVLDRNDSGTWEFRAGAEMSAGTASTQGGLSNINPDFSVHVLSDGGASATVTARVIRIKINKSLTE